MKYGAFKKRSKIKVDLRKLNDLELFFEEIPPLSLYKIQKAVSRSTRKLKLT